MASERYIEITGDSIEDAIAKGLAQLGVGPSEVIVEVLDEPSQAMFGMEARPARVRLQLLGVRPTTPPVVDSPPPEPQESAPTAWNERPARSEQQGPRERSERPERPERERPRRSQRNGGRDGGRGQRRSDAPRQRQHEDDEQPADVLEPEFDDNLPFVNEAAEIPEEEISEDITVAKVVLNELLERMDIRGRIAVRQASADDQTGNAPHILDIMSSGNSNRLVGRRGETLAALQYLTRLITSREVQHRVDVIVDVNSYKARRAQSLTNLAQRMAADAIEHQRTVTLEPMPPHERRIIHLALRDRTDVSTKSVGEGPGRKVTIVPAEQPSE
ncbi:MAG: Jag N-terminal domain-containing protein [Anaerolineae bacterium]|nr:Jag N-terminal domain-containing protein [Anaerolineae bacterium]